MILVETNMKDQKKEINKPIKKESTRKWIDLKGSKFNITKNATGDLKKESDSTNLISFPSRDEN